MTRVHTIWRRIASALTDVARRCAFAPRWKTQYARAVEAALAREQERGAWQGGEISRLRGEITQMRAEYARVREENRALLNSILGIAGIPPIPVAIENARALETPDANSAEVPRSRPAPRSGSETPASTPADKDHPPAPTADSEPVSPATGSGEVDAEPRLEANLQQGARVNAARMRGDDPARTNTAIARGKNLRQLMAPVRRRSWQQINRTLEFEAARKKTGRDAEELDA